MGLLDDILKALDRVPAWKRLQHLSAEIDGLRARVETLEAKLSSPTGECCPRCKAMTFMLLDSAPAPDGFAALGARNDHYRCSACGLDQTLMRA